MLVVCLLLHAVLGCQCEDFGRGRLDYRDHLRLVQDLALCCGWLVRVCYRRRFPVTSVRLHVRVPAFARFRALLAQTHSGRPAGFGRCSVLPFAAGDTWLSEIRGLFFARTYWGQDEIQPFAGSGWSLTDDQNSAVSCYDTKETFICD